MHEGPSSAPTHPAGGTYTEAGHPRLEAHRGPTASARTAGPRIPWSQGGPTAVGMQPSAALLPPPRDGRSHTFGASTRAAVSTPQCFPLLVILEWTFSHGLFMKERRMGQRSDIPIQITTTPIGVGADGRSIVSVRHGAGADRAGLGVGDVTSQVQGQDTWVCHANHLVRARKIIGEILAFPT